MEDEQKFETYLSSDGVGEQVTSVDGFPNEPSPWHFHSIGIVGNFIAKPVTGENNFTEEDATDALKYIFDKYGRTIAETVERM